MLPETKEWSSFDINKEHLKSHTLFWSMCRLVAQTRATVYSALVVVQLLFSCLHSQLETNSPEVYRVQYVWLVTLSLGKGLGTDVEIGVDNKLGSRALFSVTSGRCLAYLHQGKRD